MKYLELFTKKKVNNCFGTQEVPGNKISTIF